MKSFDRILFIFVFLLSGATQGATITFTPSQLGDFDTTPEEEEVDVEVTQTFSSSLTDPTTESPNELRLRTLIDAPGQVLFHYEILGSSITPAPGATIASVDFSIELSNPGIGDNRAVVSLVLKQDGDYFFYTANSSEARLFNPLENSSDFALRTVSGITASSFAQRIPRDENPTSALYDVDISQTPDFSANGSEITAFLTTSSATDNNNLDRVVDFRNLTLSYNLVPEPQSTLLLVPGLLLLTLRKRSV